MDFKDRHVLITGGSSGIGLAVARLFAERGAHIWLVARNLARLQEAQDQVMTYRASPNQCVEIISVDVTDAAHVSRALAQLAELAGVLRAELRPYGIHVSIVYPPDTDTPQLSYENRFKPPETRALAGGVVLSPETVARSILDSIARRRYTITPGLEATMVYRLTRLLGDLQHPIMDRLIAGVQRAPSGSQAPK
ncbi:MAG: SDR family NAD(P)-dependent oxidoreductase [Anaerolineae bacterium]